MSGRDGWARARDFKKKRLLAGEVHFRGIGYKKKVDRLCLRCNKLFASWGKANRLCRFCREINQVEIPKTFSIGL